MPRDESDFHILSAVAKPIRRVYSGRVQDASSMSLSRKRWGHRWGQFKKRIQEGKRIGKRPHWNCGAE